MYVGNVFARRASMLIDQLDIFGAQPPTPDGFIYRANAITVSDEVALLDAIRALPFRAFEFHGYTGKRRDVSFGWKYDYEANIVRPVDDLPAFLVALRAVAGHAVGVAPETLQQALVTEYDAGAGIGWHRDKAVYGDVVGLSLLAPCTFRLRRALGDGWQRFACTAEPRSMYLMQGGARHDWEHSIPPVSTLRYSITFRNFANDASSNPLGT